MIQAVLLDADGVVQTSAPDFVDRLKGLVQDRSSDFVSAIFAAEQPCATGAADFREALAAVLKDWEVQQPVDQVLEIWQSIEVIEGLPDLISTLKRQNVLVALATNQQSYRMNYMDEGLGYAQIFDERFYSCEVGYRKPAAEYFQSVAKTLGLPIEACLFVDDSPANVAAAREAGMAASCYQFKHLSDAADELRQLILPQLS